MMRNYKKCTFIQQFKRSLCLGIVILLITVFCIPVGAAETSNITLMFGPEGATFHLYRTADLEPDGSYTFSGQFADCPAELPGYDWLETAAEVADYAADKQPDAQKQISAGSLTFSGLSEGLYLVTGTPLISQGVRYTPVPFMVRVENEDITCYVKSDQEPVEEPITDYQVKKVWKGDDDAASRPDSVKIQLVKDGSIVETVTLNAENQWSYSWNDMGKHTWKVQEIQVPENYTATVTQNGTLFTITNTFVSSSQPSLGPGTGETIIFLWGVGGAAILSLIIIVLLRRQKANS